MEVFCASVEVDARVFEVLDEALEADIEIPEVTSEEGGGPGSSLERRVIVLSRLLARLPAVVEKLELLVLLERSDAVEEEGLSSSGVIVCGRSSRTMSF